MCIQLLILHSAVAEKALGLSISIKTYHKEVHSRILQIQTDFFSCQTVRYSLGLYAHNLADLFALQPLKYNVLIDAVDKLRAEVGSDLQNTYIASVSRTCLYPWTPLIWQQKICNVNFSFLLDLA